MSICTPPSGVEINGPENHSCHRGGRATLSFPAVPSFTSKGSFHWPSDPTTRYCLSSTSEAAVVVGLDTAAWGKDNEKNPAHSQFQPRSPIHASGLGGTGSTNGPRNDHSVPPGETLYKKTVGPRSSIPPETSA